MLHASFLSRNTLNNADYLQGSQDGGLRIDCDLKSAIDNAASTMQHLAKGGNIDKVLTKIISQSVPEMQQYVLSQREVPESKLYPLAMQVALLRMKDISTVASVMGCSDYDALCQILCEENNIMAQGLPSQRDLLSPQLQACIGFMMDEIVDKHVKAGGSGRISDVMAAINDSSNYFNKAEGADISTLSGPTYYADSYSDLADYPVTDDGSTGIMTGPTLGGSGNIGVGLGGGGMAIDTGGLAPKTIDPNSISTIPGGIQTQPTGSTSSGILDFLKKGIDFITGSAGEIAAAASTVGNAVQGTANQVASNALQDAIIKNLPLIIGIMIAIALIIVLIVYVAKRANK